jgi:hypothetical protein
MIITTPTGTTLEVRRNFFTGRENIFYEGVKVSSKLSMLGGTHVFQVIEIGETVNYEVELRSRWHGCSYSTTIRRNGILIYTDR